MQIGGIFRDLAKAIDCMNHAILLAKLHFCGSEQYLKIGAGHI